MMLAAGFFLMCGHTFVFLAFRHGTAGAVAPFYYSFTLWAVLSGLIIFHDIPNWLSIAGTLLILASGLASIALESSHAVDIEKFVPKALIDDRRDTPYYLGPEDKVG